MEAELAKKQCTSLIVHCCYTMAHKQGLDDYERMVLLAWHLANAYEIVLDDLVKITSGLGSDLAVTPDLQN